ncbi:sulfotransferase family 2 domain-containing protein [Mesorhizobium sp. B2-3-10]|uniref:sulfotransferase family 2 domain-containing protein n=1 Tax=Mesorhizobium sp. B2-3-10 TaxID=2589954 RepID=UPI0011276684|nr:sulfotransferase family 2 domain-containing protein [Mesorhizobium sp. B2-3-10]TPL92819.1 sulfotransferase family protein [Mesorhizobium sp. B2-3-10]
MIPALFLHIQKTAGTSVLAKASELYGRTNCCMHGDYLSCAPEQLDPLMMVSGHFGFDYAERFMPGRYSFTFLRDPVERLLSYYSYCRGATRDEYEIHTLAHDNDAETFFRAGETARSKFASHMWNHQACQLASGWGASLVGKADIEPSELPPEEILDRAKVNLARFDYVGLVEDFEADNAAIFAALGDTSTDVFRINAAPARITREELPSSTLELLTTLTHIDQQLYDWVVRRQRASSISARRDETAALAEPKCGCFTPSQA